MADLTILTLAGGETTGITGGYVYIIRPAATPSGFQDYRISVTNLHAALQSAINTNTSSINGLTTSVNAINAAFSKVRMANVNSSTTFNQPANSDMYLAYFYRVSGSPTVSIGTTLGGTDLVDNAELSSLVLISVHDLLTPITTTRTLYLTVTGGVIDFVRYLRQNINT